jgi:hypothetical protein
MYFEDARQLADYILKTAVRYEDHSGDGEAACQGNVCRMCRHLTTVPNTQGMKQHSDHCLYHTAERLMKSLDDQETFQKDLLTLCETLPPAMQSVVDTSDAFVPRIQPLDFPTSF